MNPRRWPQLCLGVGAMWMLCSALQSPAEQKVEPQPASKSGSEDRPEAKYRVSVAVARDRATLMHEIYESTLHAMHRHYFRKERSTLPARAMEDVFSEMKTQSKVEARWIAVNTRAMSVNHEPETDFEIHAAKEISNGKDQVELIEKGYYHRATAIPLGAGCVSCHTGVLAPPPKTPRFSGLVITIPLNDE